MEKMRHHLRLALVLALLLSGCASQGAPAPAKAGVGLPPLAGDPLQGSGQVERSLLTYDELSQDAGTLGSPVADSAFGVPEGAAAPSHRFEGVLRLVQPEGSGESQVVKDDYNVADRWGGPVRLFAFDYRFVQHGSYLIPAQQGLIYTGQTFFNLMVGTGRAWDETSDQGLTRAAFPFTLVQRNQNCTFNGVMSFLFDDQHVSQARYQVTQETCAYFKIDMWGQVKAQYAPQQIANREALVQQEAADQAARLPEKPFFALAKDYPQAGLDLAAFTEDYIPEGITTYGVVVNGVHYSAECPTRYGHYAFCDQMRLASYSTAKSALAAVTFLRLGQQYGPQVYDLLIKDLLPETQGSIGSFDKVTITNALDMRSGNFRTTEDESTPFMDAFIQSERYSDRLKAALNFPQGSAPGETFVYKTSDTFLALLAMERYAQQQTGDQKLDIFDLVANEVYAPVGLSSGFRTTLRTDNRAEGQPLGGLGLFWSPPDAAKMMVFLNNQSGAVNGQALLDPARLNTSLRKTADGAPNPDNSAQYRASFWNRHYSPENNPQTTCAFNAPYMSGFGGISLVMLPNGINLYVFDDDYQETWESALWEIQKLAPLCE